MQTRNFFFALAAVVVTVTLAAPAGATPDPTGVVIQTRIFNDCPTSILNTTNAYPNSIVIDDARLDCGGFANLHNWRFSVDGTTPVPFDNDSAFRVASDLVISGTTDGEAGLQISPWWSQDVDGRLNVRTTDGEIASFGGRLPFYSFTLSDGITYVKGTTIHLEMTYLANGLSMADPATVEFVVTYNAATYTSGPLPFDEGNPNEDPPYGLWGMLNDGRVGGHIQAFLQAGNPDAQLVAEWTSVEFDNLGPVSVEDESWGRVKALYR